MMTEKDKENFERVFKMPNGSEIKWNLENPIPIEKLNGFEPDLSMLIYDPEPIEEEGET